MSKDLAHDYATRRVPSSKAFSASRSGTHGWIHKIEIDDSLLSNDGLDDRLLADADVKAAESTENLRQRKLRDYVDPER
jgi:hypothetical protein